MCTAQRSRPGLPALSHSGMQSTRRSIAPAVASIWPPSRPSRQSRSRSVCSCPAARHSVVWCPTCCRGLCCPGQPARTPLEGHETHAQLWGNLPHLLQRPAAHPGTPAVALRCSPGQPVGRSSEAAAAAASSLWVVAGLLWAGQPPLRGGGVAAPSKTLLKADSLLSRMSSSRAQLGSARQACRMEVDVAPDQGQRPTVRFQQ